MINHMKYLDLKLKLSVFFQRYRQPVIAGFYVILIAACVMLIYDPSYLDDLLKPLLDRVEIGSGHRSPATRLPASTPAPKRRLSKLINLPFTPKNFKCEDMLTDAGRNFSYSPSYWDHLDAYKTALSLNNMLALSTSNEHDWILQEIARLPFVENVCETGFGAGETTFQWLVGNEEVVVYSFDEAKHNYSLELIDFMSIEFPERFFLFPGNLTKMVKSFTLKREGRLKCDVVFLSSTLPADVIRENLKDFKRIANRVENLIVMDSHPHNSPERGGNTVWTEFASTGEIIEHFRCYYSSVGNIGKETGITVGSYAF